MSTNWLDIMNNSGDAHLGATLLRLSRQAVAVHQAQTFVDADDARSPWAAESALTQAQALPPGAVHREVDR